MSSTTNHPPRHWRIVHSECSLGWGGQEHRVLAELSGFRRRGCEVFLLAPSASQIFARTQAAGIPAVHLHSERIYFLPEVLKIARWLEEQRVDVVNTHSSRDGWLVGLAARLAGTPLIIRTRHIDVDYPQPWISRHAFTTLANHVLTTSDKITNHLRKIFRLSENQISTVPTGIDLERFAANTPKARLEVPPGVPLVGMVSVLRSWKGHGVFLEAIRLLQQKKFPAHFVIVGDGPGRARIADQIQSLQLQECVTLTGHREDVPEVLCALNLLVMPSTRHEGVPQIGLQALATQTPVIGSDVGGIPEIIRPGETGRIFPNGDANALADEIQAALTETAQTKTRSQNGRALVEAKHSFETMLDTLDSLYRRHLPK